MMMMEKTRWGRASFTKLGSRHGEVEVKPSPFLSVTETETGTETAAVVPGADHLTLTAPKTH